MSPQSSSGVQRAVRALEVMSRIVLDQQGRHEHLDRDDPDREGPGAGLGHPEADGCVAPNKQDQSGA